MFISFVWAIAFMVKWSQPTCRCQDDDDQDADIWEEDDEGEDVDWPETVTAEAAPASGPSTLTA